MLVRNKLKKGSRSMTAKLFLLPIFLSLVGLIFIFEASSIRSLQQYHDSFYFVRLQGTWIILGITLLFFFSFFDYHRFYYLSFYLMIFNILLLLIVLLPGIGQSIGGARRWLNLGSFNLQPTEITKLTTIIYLSSWFSHLERKRFFAFLILMGFLTFLILLQPDMGTASIIFALSIFTYFFAGIDLFYLFFIIPLTAIGFYFLILISPYRFSRLMAFLNPQEDTLGISYHINQIFISFANGGLFGLGLGASRQKYLFLPEAHTDSIFAIIGEEGGFIGSLIVICVYLFLLHLLYQTAKKAKDRLGFLIASSIFTLFSLQIIINLGGMTNLFPLTGVPLPFISYGGSSTLVSFTLLGIAINIYRQGKN